MIEIRYKADLTAEVWSWEVMRDFHVSTLPWTTADLLAEKMKEKGREVVKTREYEVN